MIKLTIITPVFNSIKHINNCIESVISQGCFESIEHLIIDGDSTDGTLEVIKDYNSNYSHIKFLSEKDNGQSNAMNKGVKLAKGEYISFLNVDDFYEPKILKHILDFFISSNNYDFIVGDCNVLNSDGTVKYINRPTKLKTHHLLSGYYLPVNPSAYFYKKKIHDEIGYYNETNHYNMDVEFLINASLKYNLIYFPETWGNFQLLPDTKTVSDLNDGLLHERKKALFDSFNERITNKTKILIFYVFFFKVINSSLKNLKKFIVLPFDMVYYKSIKLLKNGK